MHLGSAGTANFQMLSGLPYLLLLVVGGVAVVSGAVFGGFALQSFVWLTMLFPELGVLRVVAATRSRASPASASVAAPTASSSHVGAEMREKRIGKQKSLPPPTAEPTAPTPPSTRPRPRSRREA